MVLTMLNGYDFLVIAGLAGLYLSYYLGKKVVRHDYLKGYLQISKTKASVSSTQQLVDMKSLLGRNFFETVLNSWKNFLLELGKYAVLKVFLFYVVLFFLARFIEQNFIRIGVSFVVLAVYLLGSLVAYQWILGKKRKEFEESFPVALNMLTSAVSAGESLTQSIAYVGETLQGRVADEFRTMGKRLQLGEPPEDVFRKSCSRFPYPTFYFFVITMRANMERGGQLKDIIRRLNRLMFDIRAIDKKKYALTSEARTSAKIVAAIPFIFLVMMRFLSPENYDYVMEDPDGRLILYYMLISEAVGIAIIWGLLKSVR
jgi:tight adherence protein B